MNNVMNILNNVQNALSNPTAFLSQIGLPQTAFQNPQMMAQQLVNSGKMSQQCCNQFYQIAQQMQSMPQFRQMVQQMLPNSQAFK